MAVPRAAVTGWSRRLDRDAVAALWRIPAVTHIPTATHTGRAVLLALSAFVLAVVLHACWDGLDDPIAHVIIGVISLTLLLVLIGVSQRRSGRSRRATQPAGS